MVLGGNTSERIAVCNRVDERLGFIYRPEQLFLYNPAEDVRNLDMEALFLIYFCVTSPKMPLRPWGMRFLN